MVLFPNCKINIGLHINGKRTDGYHNIETVFFPLQIKDALEIIDHTGINTVSFSSSGVPVDGNPENNICYKAYQLLKKDFPQIPGIKMHLHKVIPMGAGVGGGSADGAFTLQMLNTKYSLGLDQSQLINYALQLGSDCSFFVINKPCYATGRGELLEEIPLDLSAYKILLVNPGIHINTGWAFSVLKTTTEKVILKDLIAKPFHTWKHTISNDFEEPVFAAHPEIKELKDSLYAAGAIYASMSGSGSSVYGIFEKGAIAALNFPAHYFYKWG